MSKTLKAPKPQCDMAERYLEISSMLGPRTGILPALRVNVLLAALVVALSSLSFAASYDGPAELPRATVPSAMADTPASGVVVALTAGADLQTALNNAQCGDVIQLQAGATFAGSFTLPAKSCDASHWIIIRTSAADSTLPAEGQRVTPCYAGIASLAGRPQYSCANPENVLAKIQMTTAGDGPIQFAPGANHYRLIGLEITRPAGTPGKARLVAGQGTVDHLVVDRSWLHGALQDETHNGRVVTDLRAVVLVGCRRTTISPDIVAVNTRQVYRLSLVVYGPVPFHEGRWGCRNELGRVQSWFVAFSMWPNASSFGSVISLLPTGLGGWR